MSSDRKAFSIQEKHFLELAFQTGFGKLGPVDEIQPVTWLSMAHELRMVFTGEHLQTIYNREH